MLEQRVSSRYAKALISNAIELEIVDKVYADMQLIHDALSQSNELMAMTNSPIIQRAKKNAIYKEIFENNIDKLSMDFLLLLNDKGRESFFMSIFNQFEIKYNHLKNNLVVEVFSASEMASDTKQSIKQKLEDWTKKNILLTYSVDESLKGGVQIKIDDWFFDASIKNQLSKLQDSLSYS